MMTKAGAPDRQTDIPRLEYSSLDRSNKPMSTIATQAQRPAAPSTYRLKVDACHRMIAAGSFGDQCPCACNHCSSMTSTQSMTP